MTESGDSGGINVIEQNFQNICHLRVPVDITSMTGEETAEVHSHCSNNYLHSKWHNQKFMACVVVQEIAESSRNSRKQWGYLL